MKNFKKIFAILLVLSMVFFFAACTDDDDTPAPKKDESGSQPPSGPTLPSITINGVAQQITVKEGNNGTIATTANSYTFTYGTVDNSGYGNGIVRFKVSLGSQNITDFGKVTLTWTGVSGDATSNKKLSLLGTKTESEITPWKSDTNINALLIDGTTDYSNGKAVNGTSPVNVEIPISTTKTDLTGDVWLSIYTHASDGAYTISNIAFVLASGGDGGGDGDGDGELTAKIDALKALPGGITLGVGGDNAPTFDATSKVVTVTGSGSTMFYVDFANVDGLTVSDGDSLKVTYACVIETPQGKVIVKNGKNSWTDFSSPVYKEFTEGNSNTITDITATTATDGLTFQHNSDSNDANAKYYVKILNVEVVTP